jgi:hypothetical protein
VEHLEHKTAALFAEDTVHFHLDYGLRALNAAARFTIGSGYHESDRWAKRFFQAECAEVLGSSFPEALRANPERARTTIPYLAARVAVCELLASAHSMTSAWRSMCFSAATPLQ